WQRNQTESLCSFDHDWVAIGRDDETSADAGRSPDFFRTQDRARPNRDAPAEISRQTLYRFECARRIECHLDRSDSRFDQRIDDFLLAPAEISAQNRDDAPGFDPFDNLITGHFILTPLSGARALRLPIRE